MFDAKRMSLLGMVALTAAGCANTSTIRVLVSYRMDGKEKNIEEDLGEMLANGTAEVIEIPLSVVPHRVCDSIIDGDKKLQSHNGGTDVEMEATFFIAPGGQALWANVFVTIKEPKKDWSTFQGRVRDFPVYTTSREILAIMSPAQGRIADRHYGTQPFAWKVSGANDPVDTYFGVADTPRTDDFGLSGGGVYWKKALIAVRMVPNPGP